MNKKPKNKRHRWTKDEVIGFLNEIDFEKTTFTLQEILYKINRCQATFFNWIRNTPYCMHDQILTKTSIATIELQSNKLDEIKVNKKLPSEIIEIEFKNNPNYINIDDLNMDENDKIDLYKYLDYLFSKGEIIRIMRGHFPLKVKRIVNKVFS